MKPDTHLGGKLAILNEVSHDQKTTAVSMTKCNT